MKALFELFRRFDARRIFGFIRRLGGMSRPKVKCYDLLSTRALQVESDTPLGLIQRICFIFLSTPSGWRVTLRLQKDAAPGRFLSTPSGWRATRLLQNDPSPTLFLSTPSGWRAIPLFSVEDRLRMHFYPRPLGGGRRPQGCNTDYRLYFYPRPPGGGRPCDCKRTLLPVDFYPRPPGGGRREAWRKFCCSSPNFYPRPPGGGRRCCRLRQPTRTNFYPRPPGGGRHHLFSDCPLLVRFLSTPSGWRATLDKYIGFEVIGISIHALRVEGDDHTVF